MRYDRIAAALRRLQVIVGPMLAGLALGVAGNPVNVSYLDGQAPVAPDAITAYGPDLFGDRINLYNGALSFEQTDLSPPKTPRETKGFFACGYEILNTPPCGRPPEASA